MIPILYSAETTTFGGDHGLGLLADAVECNVTETINEDFELTLQYPVGGIHFDKLEDRAIIYAKPSPNRDPQAFRIYKHSRGLGKTMEFYARHISYDLNGAVVMPFSRENTTASQAINHINSNLIIPDGMLPFVFKTDFTDSDSGWYPFKIEGMKRGREILGGGDNTLLGVFGGQLLYDGTEIWLKKKRGTDKGYSYRYGVNLSDFTEDSDVSGMYTHVMGYWKSSDGEQLVYTDIDDCYKLGDHDYIKIYPVDLTSSFDLEAGAEPKISDLKDELQRHADNGEFEEISKPDSNITIKQASMFRIMGTEEEPLEIGDMVRVYYPKFNINFTEQVVTTDYNVLTNLYNSVEIGEVKKTISRTLAKQNQEIQNEIYNDYGSWGGSSGGGGYGGYAVFG